MGIKDELANCPQDLQGTIYLAKKIRGLIRQAESGDEIALKEVCEILTAYPVLNVAWDLAETIERMWIDATLSNNSRVGKEMLKAKLAELKQELAGPSASPIERLLAERVAVCWLQVQNADGAYLNQWETSTPAQVEHLQKTQDRAHRRFLSAIKTLAQVRRLCVPVLQVNVGEKQVNVVGFPTLKERPDLEPEGSAQEELVGVNADRRDELSPNRMP